MNSLISYNWVKEYLDTDLSYEDFAKKTTAIGNSVEVTDVVRAKFENMVVGDVLQVKPHPDADKLQIALTDIGAKQVDIVCGGENLAVGQKVVVGLPGAKVRWHGEADWMELKETKIRGVQSYGMICAVEEVGFEKLPHGPKDIWDITSLTDAKAGTPIAEALELDDVIFDIEVTTNRPDCKSIIGQAREGAAATGDTFTWKATEPQGLETDAGFSVQVKDSELCPRYTAVLIEGVKVGPSPWWLQKKLLLAGFKPINNIVDITNYVLHEYGQPLHAFDADMLAGSQIEVRKAKKGEKFVALDEQEYELTQEMLVIADAEKPVAVAGVMGGLETGTTDSTSRVLIECAAFDPVSVRRTARALTLYSDSQLLFEKGLSTEAVGPALARAIELVGKLADGSVASKIFDERTQPYEPLRFPYDSEKVNQLMGIELPKEEQIATLERLGFSLDNNELVVPYWRDHDIEASVDFTEEVARVYGYDNFPSRLPSGELPRAQEEKSLVWQRRVKEQLAAAGLSEAYSYALVSADQLSSYGLDLDDAVRMRNPLSQDQEYMRTNLVPSLLTMIEENQARIPEAEIFELAPVYLAKKNDIPDQELRLVIGVYGGDGAQLFFKAKGILDRLWNQVGLPSYTLERKADPKRWHATRSAVLVLNGDKVGVIGQVNRAMADAFDLDVEAVLIELDFESLVSQFTTAKKFQQVSQFPAVKRDLAFLVQERAEYAHIESLLRKISTLLNDVELFDVYRGEGVEQGQKSLAMHLEFRSDERTLEAGEVDEELNRIRKKLESEFGAIMRS